MSIVSGILSANEQSKSVERTNKANKNMTRDTNAANIALNMMSRGGAITAEDARKFGLPDSVVGKSSSLLPYYLSDLEQGMATNAADVFRGSQEFLGTPEQQFIDIQSDVSRFDPAYEQNQQLVSELASGGMTRQMLQESEPVFQGRVDNAKAKKSAGLEALQVTLNQIDAIQARKGFTGDSFGNRMLKFNARRTINNQGAQDIGAATLENAMEERALRDQGRTLQLSNLTLPDTMSRAAIERRRLPVTAVGENSNAAMAPAKFFNIGPGAASQVNGFMQTPGTSGMQIAAQGMGALGNAAMTYAANKQLQKQANGYQSYPTGFGGGGGVTSFGGGYSGQSGFTDSGTGYALTDQSLDLGDY